MTPQEMYQALRQANAATGCETFDGHVLACIFSAAASESGNCGSLTNGLGICGAALRSAIARYFPGTLTQFESLGLDTEPEVGEDELCLRELLLPFRTAPSPLNSLMSLLIARRSTRPNHLWQDLGLADRGELSRLMQRHFWLLARRNSQDMKWKKFFYRMICREDGFRMCVAPSCSECTDFDECFGDESGESLLARVRLHGETPGLASIQDARSL
jgi:nitrogen fixation protein NifQ